MNDQVGGFKVPIAPSCSRLHCRKIFEPPTRPWSRQYRHLRLRGTAIRRIVDFQIAVCETEQAMLRQLHLTALMVKEAY